MRKVLSTTVWNDDLVAVCDDGTVWYRKTINASQWRRIAQIPSGTKEEVQSLKAKSV